MVCAQFLSASPKAKVLNGIFFLFNLLAWIACCVGFGGVLMTAKSSQLGGGESKFYWNKMDAAGTTIAFGDDLCQSDFCSKCKSGGSGFIAMQVFAFIGLLAVLFLSLVRILGISISKLEPTRKVLFWELALTASNLFFFFLSVCIYGGTCFHKVAGMDNISVTGTGYGYTICCFFFLLFNFVIVYNIRSDSSTHLGSAAGSDYMSESDNTTNYNPPTAYQYGQDPAAAYAGSYNTDVMPATQSSDNNL